jgi:carbon monoxide dehydrogenase subunit G
MEIADTFRVSTPLDETWRVLLDIEGIAPCLPGAQLQEVEGNEYRGIVKVKVGPITAQYKGTATLVEADEAGRRIVLDASGRETRGQGNATASIIVTMNDDAGGTRVDVVTDLSITGKVAQFGRGVLDDVSAKLLRQFVENLERDVLANTGASAPADLEVDSPPAVATPNHTNGVTAALTGPRRIDSPEAEPIDLLEAAGASAALRLVPIAVGVVGLFVLWRLLRRRR